MKSVGVVVEYNPFHNGHFYHLNEARNKEQADVVIAVMSGYFLQRGEPALVPKWQRAKMALLGGADLVIELPYAYSTQKAEFFAKGAIQALAILGVDSVCFGSEAGDITPFMELVRFMEQHRSSWNIKVKRNMKEGMSYPTAASKAFFDLQGSQDMLDLSAPNNILGFHYVKAIRDQAISMNASTILRKSAQYHDESFATKTIASATSIRKKLSNPVDLPTIQTVVPNFTFVELQAYWREAGMLHRWEHYFPLLKYRLQTSKPIELQAIYEGEEGLENRFYETIQQATSFQDWMSRLKTKRYTWVRLQRYATHLLTNTKKSDMNFIHERAQLPYVRLLGMTEVGREYLKKNKKHFPSPVVTRPVATDDPMMEMDLRAARSYYSILPAQLQQTFQHGEFSTPPIFVKQKQS
ncbi:nucleotidyltransferase [Halalkalibacterium ligniniphilum]|uniref:nucleotidyltransferase n=1 Tax=Halalkalibacterium ligniniphilum TaxID=1134413 RepID=UPI0003450D46|nr:nucleotidyltransferase [Halalkalibacterium ligniniphilum]